MFKFKGRQGFTLIELMIVIVIISILSSGMMLSSSAAVATAQASNIVSNLRTTKAALLVWCMDNMDMMTPSFDPSVLNLPVAIGKYLDNPGDLSQTLLKLGTGDFAGKWVLGHYVEPNSMIADKLIGRRALNSLLGGTAAGPESRDYMRSDPVVWVLAR